MPPAPFATVAFQALDGMRDRLQQMSAALAGSTTLERAELDGAAKKAADALKKTSRASAANPPLFA